MAFTVFHIISDPEETTLFFSWDFQSCVWFQYRSMLPINLLVYLNNALQSTRAQREQTLIHAGNGPWKPLSFASAYSAPCFSQQRASSLFGEVSGTQIKASKGLINVSSLEDEEPLEEPGEFGLEPGTGGKIRSR